MSPPPSSSSWRVVMAFVAVSVTIMAASSRGDHAPSSSQLPALQSRRVVRTNVSCLPGTHHATRSHTGHVSNFTGVCSQYRDHSCCTATTARSIELNGDRELYGFYLNDCGEVPDACYRYLKLESCFYECDPYLRQWEHPVFAGYVHRVPVCADYCDRWYEACKDVQICSPDFVNDFTFNVTLGRYFCPANHQCRTFEQWYGNARGLCNRQWGTSFFYANDTNCFTMEFSGHNPNACVRNITSDTHAHAENCQLSQDGSAAGRLAASLVVVTAAIVMVVM
ncbi:riboflavin-binding protein-like [Sycon ciliatum]|uniref:riboflavin-binding protein-like n=1 Tax=Sycon ciliatum TaxID=27933 RepID=UPI0020AB3F85|eukprot:scpid85252/ scgid35644/ Folate receptor gamma; Folate receptor 3